MEFKRWLEDCDYIDFPLCPSKNVYRKKSRVAVAKRGETKNPPPRQTEISRWHFQKKKSKSK